jgi:class 3 adenylate cyclase
VSPELDLDGLLGRLAGDTKTELASTPDVVDWSGSLDVAQLPIVARRWVKVPDVVAVVADLKSSTQFGTGGRYAASTASIYQAATGGVVNIYNQFSADFIQIQGDGAFALFWGEKRYERAMCAGITVQTFSEDLVKQLERKWDDLPETGFKVGVASGRVLTKRIGTPRNPAQQEPVWAGKPVNYAAKAAQSADRNQLIVTGTVWDQIQGNDYLAISCGCGASRTPSLGIWDDVVIERLPESDPERQGRLLHAAWCSTHGAEFCAAVLAGKRKRIDADAARQSLVKLQFGNALRQKAAVERSQSYSRRVGLSR